MVGCCHSFTNVLSRKVTGFHRRAKHFEVISLREIFRLDDQTRWAQSSSLPVSLVAACSLMKTLC